MKNELAHLDEFRRVLSSYKLSEKLKTDLLKIQFIVLSAPTSVGRNTIAKELLKLDKFHYVVSDTTRHPRVNDGVMEQNGIEYWFKSEDEVLDGLKSGKYLEAAVIHNQQVSGISIDEIEKTYQNKKVAVTDIEIQGVDTYLKAKPDTVAIFVLPPTFEEWMRRIKGRGEMHKSEFKRRLASAIDEFEYAIKSKKFIYLINDTISESVKKIDCLISDCKADMNEQKAGEELAKKLQTDTKSLFSTLD